MDALHLLSRKEITTAIQELKETLSQLAREWRVPRILNGSNSEVLTLRDLCTSLQCTYDDIEVAQHFCDVMISHNITRIFI
jgi:hypothetical protein